jgi:hypothetical protein
LNTEALDPADATAARHAPVLERALQAFIRTTGIKAECEATDTPINNRSVDAIVRFGGDEGHTARFLAEVKRVDRLGALGAVQNQFAQDAMPYPVMLVAPYVTATTADECRRIKLPFIDTAGNAFIQAPGVFVFVRGQPKPKEEPGLLQGKATTATALRVTFVLLCDERLFNAPYRQIAKAANVALGTIGWTFFDLDERGFTTGGKLKENRRVLLGRRKLIDEWVTNYPIKLRPKLNVQRFAAEEKTWWKTVEITNYDALWGGEIAADRYTNDLRPATVTIYMSPERRRENLGRLIAGNRLRPDPAGEIEVLDRFWDFAPGNDLEKVTPGVVPLLLVYADLLGTNDPRNLEVARKLYGPWLLHGAAAP